MNKDLISLQTTLISGRGFIQEDVNNYINELLTKIEMLKSGNIIIDTTMNMERLNQLRENKTGQKGFIKEDVLNYIDELETIIDELSKNIQNDNTKLISNIVKFSEQLGKSNQEIANYLGISVKDVESFL